MTDFINNFKTQWKYVLIITLSIFFIAGGILGYQWWQKSMNKLPESEVITEEYGFLGKKFDALVTGYVVFQETEGLSELYGYIDQTNVYFKIVDYTNDEFIRSLEEKIAEGNGINIKDVSNGNILFNLGCLNDGEITADGKILNYIDKETQRAILESTEENPITIVLHFEPELGRGCLCCSFANKVWSYKYVK